LSPAKVAPTAVIKGGSQVTFIKIVRKLVLSDSDIAILAGN
jgi:hypothetical protein